MVPVVPALVVLVVVEGVDWLELFVWVPAVPLWVAVSVWLED
jgi:hypothetical protein